MAVSETIKHFSGKAVDKLKTTGRESPLDNENTTLFEGAIIETGALEDAKVVGKTDLSRNDIAILTGQPVVVPTLKEKIANLLQPKPAVHITFIPKPVQEVATVNTADHSQAETLQAMARRSSDMRRAIDSLRSVDASKATDAGKTQPSAVVSSGADLGGKTKQQHNTIAG